MVVVCSSNIDTLKRINISLLEGIFSERLSNALKNSLDVRVPFHRAVQYISARSGVVLDVLLGGYHNLSECELQ